MAFITAFITFHSSCFPSFFPSVHFAKHRSQFCVFTHKRQPKQLFAGPLTCLAISILGLFANGKPLEKNGMSASHLQNQGPQATFHSFCNSAMHGKGIMKRSCGTQDWTSFMLFQVLISVHGQKWHPVTLLLSTSRMHSSPKCLTFNCLSFAVEQISVI